MLANQQYADLVQAIGEASLGADDKTVRSLQDQHSVCSSVPGHRRTTCGSSLCGTVPTGVLTAAPRFCSPPLRSSRMAAEYVGKQGCRGTAHHRHVVLVASPFPPCVAGTDR